MRLRETLIFSLYNKENSCNLGRSSWCAWIHDSRSLSSSRINSIIIGASKHASFLKGTRRFKFLFQKMRCKDSSSRYSISFFHTRKDPWSSQPTNPQYTWLLPKFGSTATAPKLKLFQLNGAILCNHNWLPQGVDQRVKQGQDNGPKQWKSSWLLENVLVDFQVIWPKDHLFTLIEFQCGR